MKIAVLAQNPLIESHRRLVDVAESRGHTLSFIHMSHCYMNISSVAPIVYYRSNETFQDLEAIIPRISPIRTFFGASVLRQFETMGVYTLNNSLSITWSRDKLRVFQLLARKLIPLPITGIADSPEESEKLIDVVGGAPLIVRLLEGTQGKGTVFAETHQAAVSVINAFKQLKANILVQEYIQEANGADIRCVVVGDQVIAAIQRTNLSPGTKAPPHRYPIFTTPITITAEENAMAIQAVQTLKLNLATVDIIRSKRGSLVLDIDSSPNIELLEKITKADIAGPIIQFIEENAKKPD